MKTVEKTFKLTIYLDEMIEHSRQFNQCKHMKATK